ncbi:MAG: hypothetical protein IJQ81_18165 [Oscillibacter sp.]|nr:hypothetical protein [Paludibacteraceae bacterium]MBR0283489.1 hypothetical protein [Oscillibacter sp.]
MKDSENRGVRFVKEVSAIVNAINDDAYTNRSEILCFTLGYLAGQITYFSPFLEKPNTEETDHDED